MSKKSISPSGEWTICFFLFFIKASLLQKLVLWRDYTTCICSIFLLYMKSNASKKSMNNTVAVKIFTHTPSMIWWHQNPWHCRLMYSKGILILIKNFLNFRLDMIKKQCIINICSNSNKRYTTTVLSDTEVTFLEKGKMQSFIHLSIVLSSYTVLLNQRSMLKKFLVFHTSGSNLSKPTVFLLLILFSQVLSL